MIGKTKEEKSTGIKSLEKLGHIVYSTNNSKTFSNEEYCNLHYSKKPVPKLFSNRKKFEKIVKKQRGEEETTMLNIKRDIFNQVNYIISNYKANENGFPSTRSSILPIHKLNQPQNQNQNKINDTERSSNKRKLHSDRSNRSDSTQKTSASSKKLLHEYYLNLPFTCNKPNTPYFPLTESTNNSYGYLTSRSKGFITKTNTSRAATDINFTIPNTTRVDGISSDRPQTQCKPLRNDCKIFDIGNEIINSNDEIGDKAFLPYDLDEKFIYLWEQFRLYYQSCHSDRTLTSFDNILNPKQRLLSPRQKISIKKKDTKIINEEDVQPNLQFNTILFQIFRKIYYLNNRNEDISHEKLRKYFGTSSSLSEAETLKGIKEVKKFLGESKRVIDKNTSFEAYRKFHKRIVKGNDERYERFGDSSTNVKTNGLFTQNNTHSSRVNTARNIRSKEKIDISHYEDGICIKQENDDNDQQLTDDQKSGKNQEPRIMDSSSQKNLKDGTKKTPPKRLRISRVIFDFQDVPKVEKKVIVLKRKSKPNIPSNSSLSLEQPKITSIKDKKLFNKAKTSLKKQEEELVEKKSAINETKSKNEGKFKNLDLNDNLLYTKKEDSSSQIQTLENLDNVEENNRKKMFRDQEVLTDDILVEDYNGQEILKTPSLNSDSKGNNIEKIEKHIRFKDEVTGNLETIAENPHMKELSTFKLSSKTRYKVTTGVLKKTNIRDTKVEIKEAEVKETPTQSPSNFLSSIYSEYTSKEKSGKKEEHKSGKTTTFLKNSGSTKKNSGFKSNTKAMSKKKMANSSSKKLIKAFENAKIDENDRSLNKKDSLKVSLSKLNLLTAKMNLSADNIKRRSTNRLTTVFGIDPSLKLNWAGMGRRMGRTKSVLHPGEKQNKILSEADSIFIREDDDEEALKKEKFLLDFNQQLAALGNTNKSISQENSASFGLKHMKSKNIEGTKINEGNYSKIYSLLFDKDNDSSKDETPRTKRTELKSLKSKQFKFDAGLKNKKESESNVDQGLNSRKELSALHRNFLYDEDNGLKYEEKLELKSQLVKDEHLKRDLDFLLKDSEADEKSRRNYEELQEKIDSLKKFDIKTYLVQLEKDYKVMMQEMASIKNTNANELRINKFNDWLIDKIALKQTIRNKKTEGLIVKDVDFEYNKEEIEDETF